MASSVEGNDLRLAEKLLQQGQPASALPLLTQHLSQQPQETHAWVLLAIAYHQNHQFQPALQALEKALSISPQHLQARNIKAAVLYDIGRPQEALQLYRDALQLAPGDPALLLNIAIVLEETGDFNAALAHYNQSLSHNPELYPALLNRGALLLRLGQRQAALDNNLRLAARYPSSADTQFNLGEAQLSLEHWQAALSAYRAALALQATMAKAHFGSGLALSMLRRFAEATQAFSQAQALDAEICNRSMRNAAALAGGEMHEFSPQTLYLLKDAQRLNNCDWRNWKQLAAEFEKFISSPQSSQYLCERSLLFHTLVLPLFPASRFKLARNIAARIAERTNSAKFTAFTFPSTHSGKIKIGYVSPDFRKHPVATLSRRLYALHDRNKFEVYGYSLRPGDGSSLRHDIERGCDYFRELSTQDDRTAAEIIHRDGIDILIDLAGYTSFSRSEIFAMRPAPLQLFYLGALHSTGADFIDYFIADEVVIPPGAEQFFSEKIAYLSNSLNLFDNQQIIAPVKLKREDFGLPANGMVFCCHNNNYKITPDVFDSWMRILHKIPDSILWLLTSSDSARNNLRKEAALRGIAAQRLVFAEFVDNDIHLARYRLADLFLDTFQCNAGTTAAEALWAGLPVLTLAGESMAARVAASLLTAIELPELITTSTKQYEDMAVNLATHPEELAKLRTQLEQNRLTKPLFDTEQQVKNIEAVYQHIWQRHTAGLAPETFRIGGK